MIQNAEKYKHKARGPEFQYDQQSLIDAVGAVKRGELTIRGAAKKYKVPRSTIGDKVSSRSILGDRPGRPTAVPAEVEQKIVDTAIEASKRGMGISVKQLRIRTATLCKRMNVRPFKNGLPSQSWWDGGVRKRHPELVVRKPEKLGSSRARMLNPTVVNKYFHELGNLITKLNLSRKPNCMWNCDETGKSFQHTPVKILAERGSRNVISRVSENRTNVTVMACVNAVGGKMPPMLIVKGKTSASLHGFNVEEAPTGTIWTTQENGWMSDEIGEKWFKDIFLKHCGNERPQLLILDGHSSHESLGLLQAAVEQNIHIFCLPPHTTHKLQPLDVSVFGPFNAAYNTACSTFLAENPLHVINKWTFPTMFSTAWNQGISSRNIVNGFRACGIFPFNPSILKVEDMQPSMATDVPLPDSEKIPSLPDGQAMTPSLSARQPSISGVPTLVPVTSISSMAPRTATAPPDIPTSITNDSLMVSSTSLQVCPDLISTPEATSTISCVDHFDANIDPAVNLADPQLLQAISAESSSPLLSLQEVTVGENSDINCLIPLFASEAECDLDLNIDSVWNSAVSDIFLPPTPTTKTTTQTKTNARNTSHRLLTSEAVLAEKKKRLENGKRKNKKPSAEKRSRWKKNERCTAKKTD